MNLFKRFWTAGAVLFFVLGLAGPIAVFAAGPAPVDLLSVSTNNFVILSETGITNTGSHTTAITGNIGASPITAAAMNGVFCSEITGKMYGVDAAYTGSGATTCFAGDPGVPAVVPPDANKTLVDNAVGDMQTAYTAAANVTNPDHTELGAGNIGGMTLAPGLYKWSTDVTIPTDVTLSGGASDVWIFQIAGNLNLASAGDIASGTKVKLIGGAQASNVFWQVGGLTGATLGTYSTFNGTILSAKQVIVQTGAVLHGRALAQTQVTLDASTVSAPAAAPAQPPAAGQSKRGTINVVNVVVNDNGGTKTVSDFPLFVDGTPVVSGVTNTFVTNGGVYSVTETRDSNYMVAFSGDCDANGQLNLTPGQNKFCIVTNNDISGSAPVIVPPVPPLIDAVAVPDPLALPDGQGSVKYSYTLRNIGTVPVSRVTMVDDSCSPVMLVSGDTNADAMLQVSETWTYTCSTTLTETHTNNVVATGWANGITATSIATATVVVGTPVVPPLIHVTKIPGPLTLAAGGGTVTYTEKVTNPGTAALSNVALTDDKCALTYVSGDTNHDYMLDPTETWTYSCKTNLADTTTSTVVATASANGLTARDLAVATVVVAVKIDPAVVARLKGRILLQVQSHGEAWYVNPDDGKRYYMKDGAAAFAIMRKFALGILDTDIAGIPTSDSGMAGTSALAIRLKGKIVLQVQQHGKAWYVNPVNGERYSLGTPQDAYGLMRSLGLGITNQNLGMIPVGTL